MSEENPGPEDVAVMKETNGPVEQGDDIVAKLKAAEDRTEVIENGDQIQHDDDDDVDDDDSLASSESLKQKPVEDSEASSESLKRKLIEDCEEDSPSKMVKKQETEFHHEKEENGSQLEPAEDESCEGDPNQDIPSDRSEHNSDSKVNGDSEYHNESDQEKSCDSDQPKAEGDIETKVGDAKENMDLAESESVSSKSDSMEGSSQDVDKHNDKDDSDQLSDVKNDSEDDSVSENQKDNGGSALNLTCKQDSTPSEDTAHPPSEGKGSDSDKENVGETPIDLSCSMKTSPASSDVIMLSDDEEELQMNGHVNGLDYSPEKNNDKLRLIKCLQEELRNEEAKLVLLKKIRQSQFIQTVQQERSTESSAASKQGLPNSQSSQSRPSHSQPPPLVRGSQQQSAGKDSRMPPQLMRAPGQHQSQLSNSRPQNQGPPPLVMAPRHNDERRLHDRRSLPPTGPPNLIPGYRSQQQQPSPLQAAPQPPPQPEQTPAQRQAAAKLALRKQLEKTLLQIPPPKPPPPEMNFIPGVSGNEFIMLVGLEEVVKNIVDTDARGRGEKTAEVKYVFNPFVCVQCGSDYTPVWKRDKPGSKNVICEQCVTSNQKKALKQEHTNRLKSAFVKALQQEQEIEQRMQAQSSVTETKSTPSPSMAARHSSPSTHVRESTHTAPTAHSAPINLSTTTGFKPTTEQIRQHQNLIQAHQAQLRAATQGPMGFNPRLLFPFQQAQVSGKTAADLQRQYLLDMIPRSMAAGTVQWRL